jgi:hypothetical protein
MHWNFFDKIVEEHTGEMAVNPKQYRIDYHTGDQDDAASTSDIFVRFHGTFGSTKYYLLGNNFVQGQRATVDINAFESVGDL